MPAADGTISLALDFDGSLVEKDVSPLRWRPRAREFVIGAAAAGYKLWILSCRCTPAGSLVDANPWDADDFWRTGRAPADIERSWELLEEMRRFLEAEGVWDLVQLWTLPGKPFADVYADDKAEPPDWYRLGGELGVNFGHAIPGRPGPPLQPSNPVPAR